MPITTSTSWTRATSAVAPNRKSLNRIVIQTRMPIEPSRTSRAACWVSSSLITGPTVVSDRCATIGPELLLDARGDRPNFTGRRQVRRPLPGLGDGAAEAPGLAPGEAPAPAEAPGLADADGPGLVEAAALAEADGSGLAEPDALGAADPDAAGLAEAPADGGALDPADPLGATDGDGLGAAGGGRATWRDRISKKPSLVAMTVASVTPWFAKAVLIRSASTGRILELDLPGRAAGVVDRELQADGAVGQRGQDDEDEAGDREDQREQEEPAALADDVKHGRGPGADLGQGSGPGTRPRRHPTGSPVGRRPGGPRSAGSSG